MNLKYLYTHLYQVHEFASRISGANNPLSLQLSGETTKSLPLCLSILFLGLLSFGLPFVARSYLGILPLPLELFYEVNTFEMLGRLPGVVILSIADPLQQILNLRNRFL